MLTAQEKGQEKMLTTPLQADQSLDRGAGVTSGNYKDLHEMCKQMLTYEDVQRVVSNPAAKLQVFPEEGAHELKPEGQVAGTQEN